MPPPPPPDTIKEMLLKIRRMKKKISGKLLKGIVFKGSDTDELEELLASFCDEIDLLKSFLEDTERTKIMLVSIPTEAGFMEFYRTINFLKSIGLPANTLIINHIVPDLKQHFDIRGENPAGAISTPPIIVLQSVTVTAGNVRIAPTVLQRQRGALTRRSDRGDWRKQHRGEDLGAPEIRFVADPGRVHAQDAAEDPELLHLSDLHVRAQYPHHLQQNHTRKARWRISIYIYRDQDLQV